MKKRRCNCRLASLALACGLLLGGCAAGRENVRQAEAVALTPPVNAMPTRRQEGTGAAVDWTELSSSVLVHSWEEFSAERDADLDEFFRVCGFDEAAPFYTYNGRDGAPQLVLYYDAQEQRGVGVRYEYDPGGRVCRGFGFETLALAEEEARWSRWEADYTAVPELDSQIEVEEYRTETVRDGQGRMTVFRSYGVLEDVAGLDEREEERIFSADYEYDADGVLRRRQFGQTQKLFPSSDSSWDSYFDGQGRVCYEHGYHTHGGQEYYYIYAGKEEAPAYCLYLDNDCGYYTGEFVRVPE